MHYVQLIIVLVIVAASAVTMTVIHLVTSRKDATLTCLHCGGSEWFNTTRNGCVPCAFELEWEMEISSICGELGFDPEDSPKDGLIALEWLQAYLSNRLDFIATEAEDTLWRMVNPYEAYFATAPAPAKESEEEEEESYW